jgi:hypothetical protein
MPGPAGLADVRPPYQLTLSSPAHAEAVLHACESLQAHLRAQDLAIRHVVEHMGQCRPSQPA